MQEKERPPLAGIRVSEQDKLSEKGNHRQAGDTECTSQRESALNLGRKQEKFPTTQRAGGLALSTKTPPKALKHSDSTLLEEVAPLSPSDLN